jgi:hypothetical protein
LNPLKIIFLAFCEICVLKRKPQDLPVSGLFLGLCAVTYTISSFLLAYAYQDLNNSLTVALIDIGLMMMITWLLLVISRKPGRWVQTSTALLGTGTIFSLLASPIYYSFSIPGTDASGNVLLTFMVWILIVWNVIVMAHILRHALSVSFVMGVFVALGYVFIISSTIITMTAEQVV